MTFGPIETIGTGLVTIYRISTGGPIGSLALVADADGLIFHAVMV